MHAVHLIARLVAWLGVVAFVSGAVTCAVAWRSAGMSDAPGRPGSAPSAAESTSAAEIVHAIVWQKAPLLALIAWCAGLLALRVACWGDPRFGYLFWNLQLAAIPFAAAICMRALPSGRGYTIVKVALLGVWIAFLPNAPYLVTDLVHLEPAVRVPFWFDVALLGSYALVGALLGYSAVADVQAVVARRAGRVAGWVAALGSLLLCGLGMYLGRYLRWNSWDLFTAPDRLGQQMIELLSHPIARPGPWEVSLAYAAILLASYLALRALSMALRAAERSAA